MRALQQLSTKKLLRHVFPAQMNKKRSHSIAWTSPVQLKLQGNPHPKIEDEIKTPREAHTAREFANVDEMRFLLCTSNSLR